MEKISAVYKITNIITGDFYIGSSKDVKRRWRHHRELSVWERHPNSLLYQGMQKYGIDSFELQVIAEVEPEQLKEAEQKFIETLHPTYNINRAKGWNIERRKEYMKEYRKEYQKEYQKSDKYKEYQKEYQKSDKYKEYQKKYQKEYEKTDKRKKYKKEHQKEYQNQICSYNGEILKLGALSSRFRKAGIEHCVLEAKKYLIK